MQRGPNPNLIEVVTRQQVQILDQSVTGPFRDVLGDLREVHILPMRPILAILKQLAILTHLKPPFFKLTCKINTSVHRIIRLPLLHT